MGRKARILDRIALLVAMWFGVGLLPGIPGTFGTVGAIPLYVLVDLSGTGYQALWLAIVIAGAIWSSHRAQQALHRPDPREIVIDEVAGFLLTTAFLPLTWSTVMAGFFLFRFFDILKPFPISRIDQKVPGGLGIVLDDLVAGGYAHAAVRILLFMLT